MSNKPILFHDIDGVLFGEYEGEFQLRPGVKTWLKWVNEHFEVVWLTSWHVSPSGVSMRSIAKTPPPTAAASSREPAFCAQRSDSSARPRIPFNTAI